jgi:hypothetical protein
VIRFKDLKEEDKGQFVIYTDGVGNQEKGRIKWWNHKYIFVVYKCGEDWDNYEDYTAAATDPKDLTWG